MKRTSKINMVLLAASCALVIGAAAGRGLLDRSEFWAVPDLHRQWHLDMLVKAWIGVSSDRCVLRMDFRNDGSALVGIRNSGSIPAVATARWTLTTNDVMQVHLTDGRVFAGTSSGFCMVLEEQPDGKFRKVPGLPITFIPEDWLAGVLADLKKNMTNHLCVK
jgi:hypothetical protein